MPARAASEKEAPRTLSRIIAWLDKGQLWFIYGEIISPTRYILIPFTFLLSIVLHNFKLKKQTEYTTGSCLIFFYSGRGFSNRNIKSLRKK